jgi:uncharacterized protein
VREYLVFNCTRQTVVASQLRATTGAWGRMKGLIGMSGADFKPGMGLWINPAEGVHTIGMRFPIDVAYLDEKRRVVHVCNNLRPMRFAALKLNAHSVIELPAGTLAHSGTNVGDLLLILGAKN